LLQIRLTLLQKVDWLTVGLARNLNPSTTSLTETAMYLDRLLLSATAALGSTLIVSLLGSIFEFGHY